ncbi:hypothetical protein P4B35_18395 [Pontiellaceae bacterium B12227]|nr:hypothetical protein [Pontiellaceae bacterium B12227]
MIIKRIIHKDYHAPVYGSLDQEPSVKAKLADPPEFIKDMIGYSGKNSFVKNLGLRVAAISSRHFDAMNARMEQTELTEYFGHMGMENVLSRVRDCYPGGAEVDLSNRFYCDKYAACPWCRFRKAVEIGGKLEPHLKKSGGLAVIKITRPDHFEFVSPDEHADYTKLINTLCKKKKLFSYDAVVTMPNWYRNYLYDDEKRWVFSKETTIIGILPKGVDSLPLPEEVLSAKAREDMPFCGASSWSIMKPTTKHLRYALGYAMRYPVGLLSEKLNPQEYIDCLLMQSGYRVAYHGFPRGNQS